MKLRSIPRIFEKCYPQSFENKVISFVRYDDADSLVALIRENRALLENGNCDFETLSRMMDGNREIATAPTSSFLHYLLKKQSYRSLQRVIKFDSKIFDEPTRMFFLYLSCKIKDQWIENKLPNRAMCYSLLSFINHVLGEQQQDDHALLIVPEMIPGHLKWTAACCEELETFVNEVKGIAQTLKPIEIKLESLDQKEVLLPEELKQFAMLCCQAGILWWRLILKPDFKYHREKSVSKYKGHLAQDANMHYAAKVIFEYLDRAIDGYRSILQKQHFSIKSLKEFVKSIMPTLLEIKRLRQKAIDVLSEDEELIKYLGFTTNPSFWPYTLTPLSNRRANPAKIQAEFRSVLTQDTQDTKLRASAVVELMQKSFLHFIIGAEAVSRYIEPPAQWKNPYSSLKNYLLFRMPSVPPSKLGYMLANQQETVDGDALARWRKEKTQEQAHSTAVSDSRYGLTRRHVAADSELSDKNGKWLEMH
jgi:hypothetical protein